MIEVERLTVQAQFVRGDVDTGFIPKYGDELNVPPPVKKTIVGKKAKK